MKNLVEQFANISGFVRIVMIGQLVYHAFEGVLVKTWLMSCYFGGLLGTKVVQNGDTQVVSVNFVL